MAYIHKSTYSHYSVDRSKIKPGDFLFARIACSENKKPIDPEFQAYLREEGLNAKLFEEVYPPVFPFAFSTDPMAGFRFGEVLRVWKNIIWIKDYFGNEVGIKNEDEIIRVSHHVTTLTVK